MSNRYSQIVILCEDIQQESFIRRFLKKAHGIQDHLLRVIRAPRSTVSGEQFVRNNYANELKALRQRQHRAKTTLIVAIDADNKEIHDIVQTLNTSCINAGIAQTATTDNVAFIIPKRNIETWIDYLSGKEEKTTKTYNKLSKESECQPAVEKLHDLCKKNVTPPPDFPDSLATACSEYRKVKDGFSA